jgi:hypothetical protein
MKKAILLFSLISVFAITAMAQKETKTFSVGLGLEAGIPTGNISDAYNFAAGLTVRFSYHAGPGFITLTTGGIGYAPKKIDGENTKVGLQIPVKAGYKYIIQHHFFVMGEFGYANFKTYYGSNGSVEHVSTGTGVIAPAIGVQSNAFEVSLRYEVFTKNSIGGLAALRIGFNF